MHNRRTLRFFLFPLAIVALSANLRADSLTVLISTPNPGLSAVPGPYATVGLNLSGSQIDVTVTPLATFTIFPSGTGLFGFNVVGGTRGLQISGLPEGMSYSDCGGQFEDFGCFDVAIWGPAAGDSLSALRFSVTRPQGFSSVYDLFRLSSETETPSHFVAHVGPASRLTHWLAGDVGGIPIPEPTSIALFGAGLVFVLGHIRERRSLPISRKRS